MALKMSVSFDLLSTGWSRLSPELAVPERFEAEVDDDDCPYLVHIKAEVVRRRPVISAATLSQRDGGPSLTTAGLRAAKLKEYLSHMTAHVSMNVIDDGQGGFALEPVDEAAEWRGAYFTAAGLPDRDLARVAKIYADAIDLAAKSNTTAAPTKAVAEALSVSHATAQRRVRAAREAGYDLPAPPRRPTSGGAR